MHSSVTFEVGYLGGSFKGQFREIAAELVVDGERASLTGSSPVASIDVKDENLAAHLQSPDFFDAERNPELSFGAEGLSLEGDQVEVPGELTIKGVTKPVVATGSIIPTLTDGYGRERVGLKLSTTADRTDFGIDWNMPLPSGEPALSNEVTIEADLYFTKA